MSKTEYATDVIMQDMTPILGVHKSFGGNLLPNNPDAPPFTAPDGLFYCRVALGNVDERTRYDLEINGEIIVRNKNVLEIEEFMYSELNPHPYIIIALSYYYLDGNFDAPITNKLIVEHEGSTPNQVQVRFIYKSGPLTNLVAADYGFSEEDYYTDWDQILYSDTLTNPTVVNDGLGSISFTINRRPPNYADFLEFLLPYSDPSNHATRLPINTPIEFTIKADGRVSEMSVYVEFYEQDEYGDYQVLFGITSSVDMSDIIDVGISYHWHQNEPIEGINYYMPFFFYLSPTSKPLNPFEIIFKDPSQVERLLFENVHYFDNVYEKDFPGAYRTNLSVIL